MLFVLLNYLTISVPPSKISVLSYLVTFVHLVSNFTFPYNRAEFCYQ